MLHRCLAVLFVCVVGAWAGCGSVKDAVCGNTDHYGQLLSSNFKINTLQAAPGASSDRGSKAKFCREEWTANPDLIVDCYREASGGPCTCLCKNAVLAPDCRFRMLPESAITTEQKKNHYKTFLSYKEFKDSDMMLAKEELAAVLRDAVESGSLDAYERKAAELEVRLQPRKLRPVPTECLAFHRDGPTGKLYRAVVEILQTERTVLEQYVSVVAYRNLAELKPKETVGLDPESVQIMFAGGVLPAVMQQSRLFLSGLEYAMYRHRREDIRGNTDNINWCIEEIMMELLPEYLESLGAFSSNLLRASKLPRNDKQNQYLLPLRLTSRGEERIPALNNQVIRRLTSLPLLLKALVGELSDAFGKIEKKYPGLSWHGAVLREELAAEREEAERQQQEYEELIQQKPALQKKEEDEDPEQVENLQKGKDSADEEEVVVQNPLFDLPPPIVLDVPQARSRMRVVAGPVQTEQFVAKVRAMQSYLASAAETCNNFVKTFEKYSKRLGYTPVVVS